MLGDVLFAIAAVVLMLGCVLFGSGRAPAGWHWEGAAPPREGLDVVRDPARWLCDSKAGCDDQVPDPRVPSLFHCTGGSRPIVGAADPRVVGCAR